jgi:hypothetical protein
VLGGHAASGISVDVDASLRGRQIDDATRDIGVFVEDIGGADAVVSVRDDQMPRWG